MSSKLVGIVGSTGTGKSTSIKHLDPEETYIINVAKKELPFKGSEKLYNVEKKNYKEVDDANEISRLLKTISEKAPHVKNIIIEDSNYIMGFNMVSKATETGFTKFSVMAKDMVDLFRTARQLRDDITVFYLTHPEEVMDGQDIIGYKIKTAGKLIDNQVLLEGLLTVCLYTNVEENKDGTTNYQLITNRHRKIPAKSPDGMFPELKIPNNLQLVADSLKNYYNA
ncbi:MAG: AAA family ATPase [Ignisphaera sp.]|nr:AAA family ATPase [Ignisphaera sp.]